MSEATHTRGGIRTPALAHASADQVTILGDGTTEHPLRAGSGAGVAFRATFRGSGDPILGQAVVATADAPTVGIASVTPGDATPDGLHQVIGVVARIAGPGDVVVQSTGTLTLTAQQWDAVTGDSGGLLRGDLYYLSREVGAGGLSRLVSAGQWVAQVGVALSATEMQLSALPAFPIFEA
jgi:hypothetical protein